MTSIKKGMDISCVCVSVSFNSSHLRVRPLCNSKEDFVRAHLQLWSDGSSAFTLPQSAFSLSCACVVAAALPSRRGNPLLVLGGTLWEREGCGVVNYSRGVECWSRSARGPGLLPPDGCWRLPLPLPVLGI